MQKRACKWAAFKGLTQKRSESWRALLRSRCGKLANDKVIQYTSGISHMHLLAYLFWRKMIICVLCCRRTPIEFVKIEVNCFSGLCIAVSDHPQPLLVSWDLISLARGCLAVLRLFIHCCTNSHWNVNPTVLSTLNMFICSSSYLKLA